MAGVLPAAEAWTALLALSKSLELGISEPELFLNCKHDRVIEREARDGSYPQWWIH